MDYRLARNEDELRQARELRRRVFTGEQGVELETDNPDGLHDALQVVAVDDSGAVVGTCRVLLVDGACWLGRLAVEPALRGQGIAQGVLVASEDAARLTGATVMRLHSQDYVEQLYARNGYTRFDEPFEEHGILHFCMEKSLA